MVIKKDQINKSRLKISKENFIKAYIEILEDGSILKKTWPNIAQISHTEKPFIGYIQVDNSPCFETQYQLHLKSTGMFYFNLKNDEENVQLVSNVREKHFIVNLLGIIVIMSIIIGFLHFFNQAEDIRLSLIGIGGILVILFSLIRPFFQWLSARYEIYQRLVKS